MQLEPLGSRKPTEFLAKMMELCPADQDSSVFFLFLFIQRLPRELCMLLDEDGQFFLPELAAKADKLWVNCQHGTVTAVDVEDTIIARGPVNFLIFKKGKVHRLQGTWTAVPASPGGGGGPQAWFGRPPPPLGWGNGNPPKF
jgi:hypothetical protein